MRGNCRACGAAWLVAAWVVAAALPGVAVELLPGFGHGVVVSGLHDPDAMEFAPDGRLFVAERITGRLRVVKDGKLLDEPFLTVKGPPEVVGAREEASRPGFVRSGIYHYGSYRSAGLRGIAFDPEFARNGHVYVFYMADEPRVNRVSRFTASAGNADVAQPGSEKVLLEIPMSAAGGEAVANGGSHNGGALLFGGDGKLYVSVGDGWEAAPANAPQELSNLIGKILRINRDGSVPGDNPFVGQAGARGEIWALGFRNPYTLARHPQSGAIYVNDVVWGKETVYELARGANYGHPALLGKGGAPPPALHRASGLIAGGTWYFGKQFPERFRGRYFLSDWRSNVIRVVVAEQERAVPFAVKVAQPSYLKVGPDGSLYWLSTDYETLNGRVGRIFWSGGQDEPVAGAGESRERLDEMEHHWPLDEGAGGEARDVARRGTHGTLRGAVAHGEDGMVFAQDGGRVELGSLDLRAEEFSIALWLRAQSFLTGMADNRVVSKATGVGERDHWWMLGTVADGGGVRLRFRLKTGGSTSTLIARSGGLVAGKWVHVVASYDGRHMHLFADGERVGMLAKQGAVSQDGEVPVWLGDNPPLAGSRPWHGTLRDLRIYRHALTAAEVAALAGAGVPGGGGRGAVVEAYQPALELAGDAAAGQLIFAQRCAGCHQPAGENAALGPDLAAVVAGPAELLESIVDPERKSVGQYWQYALRREDGEVLRGMLSGESATGLNVRTLDGKEQRVARGAVASLRRERRSLMPDGLEGGLSPQDMANLLTYVESLGGGEGAP